MVIYYSYSKNTEKYAKELAGILQAEAFELKETKRRSGVAGFLSGGFQTLMKKESLVEALPDISACKEIYVCMPIWVGNVPPAVRYFLNRGDFAGKTVNLLITCGSATEMEGYRQNAEKTFKDAGCVTGAVLGFVCPMKKKEAAASEDIKEQLSAMLQK